MELSSSFNVDYAYIHSPYSPCGIERVEDIAFSGSPPASSCASDSPGPSSCESDQSSVTNLYVGNIPAKFDDKLLRALFEPFGPVVSAKVVTMEHHRKARYGFVQFLEPQMAQKAVSLNGTEAGGKTLTVKLADRDKDKGIRNSPSTNVYASNLPLSFTVTEVTEIFQVHGKVTSAIILKDQHKGISRGIGLVRYSTVAEATEAVKQRHGEFLPDHDRPLEVKFAENDDEKKARRKGKEEKAKHKGARRAKQKAAAEAQASSSLDSSASFDSESSGSAESLTPLMSPMSDTAGLEERFVTYSERRKASPHVVQAVGLPSQSWQTLGSAIFAVYRAVGVVPHPSGHAFVAFPSRRDATRACEGLDNTVHAGCTLRVSLNLSTDA